MQMDENENQNTTHRGENESSTNKNTEEENSKKNENVRINDDIRKGRNDKNVNIFLLICVIGITLGMLLNTKCTKDSGKKRKYWVYSAHSDVDNKNGLLKHVHLVLERIGYEKSTNDSSWSLLWSHDYPFRSLYPNMHRLKPHQKVNHFPGIGFIAQKVELAITDSKYIPKAFKLPENKDKFLKYASENKNALFLEKHNQHRGVHLKNVSAIDLTTGKSFVQQYVQNPFLVDGHKFDIGVYVAVTSVNPLRLYWYKGEVLFRYCPAKYLPLDHKNLDKYVIGDDYKPTWEVPSLAHPYSALGVSMKDAFDMYAQSKGKNTTKMWEEVQKAIVDIFLKKEHHIVDALKQYKSQDNFFEMLRFDLIVDEDLRVYLLEANMSPNLSSAHFPPNQLLYEQLLYNLFSLTGITNDVSEIDLKSKAMVSSERNIAVWTKECSTTCKENCGQLVCKLCRPCIDGKLRNSLLRAHREYLHKGDFRRLFPPSMEPGSYPDAGVLENMTEYNKLQYLWYQSKCNTDVTWCN